MYLVSNVEERCQCGFSVSTIMSPNFQCFEQTEDAVMYRAEISGTPLALPNQIEEWLSEGALILFDIVLGSCQIVVSSIVDPECNTPIPVTTGLMTEATSASPMETLGAIVGGAIGVIIVLVVAVIIVIIIILLVRAKRSGVFVVKNNRYAV